MHRRNADPPADPPVRQRRPGARRVRGPARPRRPRPTSRDLLRAGLGAVGVVRRREHRVGDLAHPPAVEARPRDRAAPAPRPDPGRAAARLSATAPPNECPTTTTGPSASASSRPASAADVGVDGPRRRPRRPAVTEQVRRDDRELRAGAASPASPSAGRVRSGRGSPGSGAARAGRSGSTCSTIVHGCRCCQPAATTADLSDPRGVMSSCPHRTPTCRPPR